MKKFLSLIVGAGAVAAMAAPASAAYTGENPVVAWDHLWVEILVDITVIGAVLLIAAIIMLLKYRAKSPKDVGNGPKMTRAQSLAWALIPAAIFMADDFFLSAKGWTLWNLYRRVPENALEVKVTGYQWYWEFDYGDEVKTDSLTVPVGRPVVLRMTAQDVIHSFFMPAYRVKEDVMPGRVTYIWFVPTEAGKVISTCTEFCGTNHSNMFTTVEAVAEGEFNQWLESKKQQARDLGASPEKKA